MSIISLSYFLFVFAAVTIYYVIPKTIQWKWLLVVSYVFYLMAGIKYVGYLLFTTISTFLCGRWIGNLDSRYAQEVGASDQAKTSQQRKEIKARFTKKKRRVLALAMVVNFGVLGVVKYANFVIDNLNSLLSLFGIGKLSHFHLILPLGISFYIFQSMGYLMDVYRGKVKPDKSIFRFALFVSYFPQIIQGPIGRYQPLANQLYEQRKFSYEKVKFGAQRMLWGYFKKLVIADRIAVVVNEVFANYIEKGYEGFIIFIAVFLYGIQIYADFSSGIDIVCGVSEMLGIDLAENFRRPFMARSVAEFWQRWHITLGAWMRDYLFYPLALSKPFNKMSRALRRHRGNYVAKVLPTCLASFIVFVLIGIWHGASWKYVAYGLYQAAFVSTATLFEPFYAKCRGFLHVDPKRFDFRIFQTLRTLFIITVGRYFSRAVAFRSALSLFEATLKSYNPWVFFDGTLYNLGLDRKNFQFMILVIAFLFLIDFLQERGIHLRERIARQGIVFRWCVYFAGIFAIIIFGMYGQEFDASVFIYQGF